MFLVMFRDYDITNVIGSFDRHDDAKDYIDNMIEIHGPTAYLPDFTWARAGDLTIEVVEHNPEAS